MSSVFWQNLKLNNTFNENWIFYSGRFSKQKLYTQFNIVMKNDKTIVYKTKNQNLRNILKRLWNHL